MEIYQSVAPLILVLEGSEDGLERIKSLLTPYYRVVSMGDGESALEACRVEAPDLILIDTTRPGNTGVDNCLRLKEDPLTRAIPVILMTSNNDADMQHTIYEIGAADYITRPLCPPTLLARVRAQLISGGQSTAQRQHQDFLDYETSMRQVQVDSLQKITLLALAALAEARDFETGNHLKRTQHYVRALGNHLLSHPRFCNHLNAQRLRILFQCAPLHDIGKVGIPDRILLKPGRYEAAEFEVMKQHPKLGRDAIQNAQDQVGDHSEFLEVAKEIVYSHHEKWDGSGYPQGLVGDAIPVSARLMAIADVYDALRSRRIYKEGMSHAEASAIIVDGRSKHFDPDVVDAYLELGDVFEDVARRFADSDRELQQKHDMMSSAV